MFKRFALGKLAKTVAAPFTQLKNIRAAKNRDVAKTITSVPPNVPTTKKQRHSAAQGTSGHG